MGFSLTSDSGALKVGITMKQVKILRLKRLNLDRTMTDEGLYLSVDDHKEIEALEFSFNEQTKELRINIIEE